MSAHALVWWATCVALVVVLALAGAQVARALRELKRVKARVAAFGDLPVVKALANVRGRRAADRQPRRRTSRRCSSASQAALAVIRAARSRRSSIAAAQRLRAEIVAAAQVRRALSR